MSRTYRFLGVDYESLVGFYKLDRNKGIYDYKRRKYLDMHSKDGKRFVALMFRDGSKAFMKLKGPGWFHRFTEKKHRTESKIKLRKHLNSNPIIEFNNTGCYDCGTFLNSSSDLIIESKPSREWWW